jgi:VIT1/CCC1 family predicted Fe2+/Mn2+ transporter
LAIWFSIGIAITGLFILGVWSSKIAKVHWLRRSVTMAVLGGSTILLGILVGQLVNRFA